MKLRFLINAFGVYFLTLILISCDSVQSNPTPEQFSNAPDTIIQEVRISDTCFYNYAWLEEVTSYQSLMNIIRTPLNYYRGSNHDNSFASWLCHLPISSNEKVYLYDGQEKYNQNAQFKVINIDVGTKDLQQCADAVMRLRAEYLYSTNQFDKIKFNYTNGKTIAFNKWQQGHFPKLVGNNISWVASSSNNGSYQSFRRYMDNIFTYAGTSSLSKELIQVESIKDIKAGDVFIRGGFPGHAVIVVDVCENKENNDKCFLLAQSYMPAQNIHVLKNPNNLKLSPWYSIKEIEDYVITPEWTFDVNELKRFKE
ncbi:MAG: DUF4846 domain-containing protein [Flavobacteriales bacterium]|nr:DUF4846 domain-containing protein [Flavobacteriales bacterium]